MVANQELTTLNDIILRYLKKVWWGICTNCIKSSFLTSNSQIFKKTDMIIIDTDIAITKFQYDNF